MNGSVSLKVNPGKPLEGEIGGSQGPALPGDKSLSHRAALLGAMSNGTSVIRNLLVSGVTWAMLEGLTTLEVPWKLDGTELTIYGTGLEKRTKEKPVELGCGNSATTLRLLTGGLAGWDQTATLDGSAGLRHRPMGRIIAPLKAMGVDIDGVNDCAPITLRASGKSIAPLHHTMSVASAQVKSCLLLAALAADGELSLEEPGPSRDHTERMLRAMGVAVSAGTEEKPGGKTAHWTRITPPNPFRLSPLSMTIPGDMSAAAFLIAAALIAPDSHICIRNVGINQTRTGFLDTLLEMGANIDVINNSEQGGEPIGDLVIQHSELHAIRVNGDRVVRMIDEFPAFAVVAAFAKGLTIVSEAEELRHKESDRISAIGEELRSLEIDFQETPDGFKIQGGKPVIGGVVGSHGDHRLAMSLALIGLAAKNPVTVMGAEIIQESFPGFVETLQFLGANLEFAGIDLF